jgi:hypothetical protein
MKSKPIIISIALISILFLILFLSASINDIKPTICNSINLTEPNCTAWWNTLNLTDANLTNITIIYAVNNYTTMNNTYYDYSNETDITYTGNYTIYNITNNITTRGNGTFNTSVDLSNYYSKSEVNSRIPDTGDFITRGEIDGVINKTMQNSSLSYVVRTVNDIETVWKVWLWIIGIIVFILMCIVGYLLFGGGG